MKKIIFIAFLPIIFNVYPQVGCLDTSSHLEEQIDYKQLRPVSCNCPCKTILKKTTNQCLECQHFHVHNRQEIIGYNRSVNYKTYKKSYLSEYSEIPKIIAKTLLVHRKNS